MSEETGHKPYDWAEQLFRGDYEVAPKYRDMLAMLAATMMGNPGAAQHFYNRALVNGASDVELRRVVEISQSAAIEIGDLTANVERAAEQIRSEREQTDETGNQETQPEVN
jgi:hypothetical protein